MSDDREKLIEKIRKIQRKAEGTSSEAEAMSFLEKMSNLMKLNSISMKELQEKDTKVGFGFSTYNLNYSDAWRKKLMYSLAKMCGCIAVLQMGEDKSPMKIYGRPENVEITIDTYIYVHDQIKAICRTLYPGDRKSYLQAQKGLTHGVEMKIYAISQEIMKEAAGGSTDTSVPMMVESDIVRDSITRTLDLKKVKLKPVSATEAAINGMMAADQVSIRKVVR